jgi:toxin ParE1/3/4
MRLLLSEKAESDLLRVHAYIEERNPAAADRVIERIHRKLIHLSEFPFTGPERSDLELGLRGAVVGNHLIFYRIINDTIFVSRIIDGRMDIDEEFSR